MKKDDRVYLDHILESFAKVISYLENVSYEAFLAAKAASTVARHHLGAFQAVTTKDVPQPSPPQR
jgi:uncharacterized protein with HEPN domain